MSSKRLPFWYKKWSGQLCGITHSRLRPGKNKNGNPYCVFLDCKHGFYRSVITKWANSCLQSTPRCPVCRRKFKLVI